MIIGNEVKINYTASFWYGAKGRIVKIYPNSVEIDAYVSKYLFETKRILVPTDFVEVISF